MLNYHIGQTVEGIVESVFPFGIFVRLGDTTKAYIRRRELDLDADVDPVQIVCEGEKVAGVVISLGDAQKGLELSRRAAMPDHWGEFIRRFRVGSVVSGTVQSLNSHGVFVRLLPGVDGFVPLQEMATWEVSRPEEVVWVDDRVEAIITQIALGKKKVWLSIKARLEQRAKISVFIDRIHSTSADGLHQEMSSVAEVADYGEEIDPSICQRVGPILIVDDHAEVRVPLTAWLARYGFEVSKAESLSEGLTKINQRDWRVLVVDLNLQESDGLELVRSAWELGSKAHICVMSSPDSLAERAADIERAGISQVFAKPLDMDEIKHFLLLLSRGESVPRWRAATQPAASIFPVFPDITEIGRMKTPLCTDYKLHWRE